jgi:hypothetical protein
MAVENKLIQICYFGKPWAHALGDKCNGVKLFSLIMLDWKFGITYTLYCISLRREMS